MTAAIIGTGGIGSAIARELASGRESLRLSSANNESARTLAAQIGRAAVVAVDSPYFAGISLLVTKNRPVPITLRSGNVDVGNVTALREIGARQPELVRKSQRIITTNKELRCVCRCFCRQI
jgi:hypothetical protein